MGADAQTMRAGVSYFGSRILRHVAADMRGLADLGYTGVLHTYSENDLFYYRDQMRRIVAASHDAGLSVQVGPWGVAGVFGGEAETIWGVREPDLGQVFDDGTRTAAICPSQPRLRVLLRQWIEAALESGADQLFWDEPHWAHPSTYGRDASAWACVCVCCRALFRDWYDDDLPRGAGAREDPRVDAFRERVLLDLLSDLLAAVRAGGGRSAICLLPAVPGWNVGLQDWAGVARVPGLDVLATDPYWSVFGQPAGPYVAEQSRRLVAAVAGTDVGAQVWIQGYRLEPHQSDEIRAAVAAARSAGVEDLWTWAYESCAQMSQLAGSDPAASWSAVTRALTGRG